MKIQPGVRVIVRPSRALALNLDPDRAYRVWVVHDRNEPGTNRFLNLPPWAKTSVTIEVPLASHGSPLRAGEPPTGISREAILDAEDCALYVQPVKVKRKPVDREAALYRLRRDSNLRWGGWTPVNAWTRLASREKARRLRVAETETTEVVSVQGDLSKDFALFADLQRQTIAAAFAIPVEMLNDRYGQPIDYSSIRPKGTPITPPMDFDLAVNRVIVIEGDGPEASHVLRLIHEQAIAGGHPVIVNRADAPAYIARFATALDANLFERGMVNWRQQHSRGVLVIAAAKPRKSFMLTIKTVADLYIVCSEGTARVVKDRSSNLQAQGSIGLGLCHPDPDDAPTEGGL